MLKPDDRQTLLSALRPPPGFALDYAIATTYTLDLYALLAAPLAFTGFEWESRTDGNATQDVQPLALLQALRRHASRLALFCQAGAVHVPSTYSRLFTYLEDSIVQVKAPSERGKFHPKVWALRYTLGKDVVYRLLVSSRNLTYDRSWDTLVVLEGEAETEQRVTRNQHLGAFFDALSSMWIRKPSAEIARRVRQFARELPRVAYAVPEPFTELTFWPSGIPGGEAMALPLRVDKLLVVSPFVSDKHLDKRLLTSCDAVTLVSRPDTLAALPAAMLSRCAALYTLSDYATPEDDDAAEQGTSAAGPDTQLNGLHAKLYIADSSWDAHVFAGSANATTAAREHNVEFMVELRGKRSACGVEAFLGETPDDKNASRSVDGFRPLLVEYKPSEAPTPDELAQIALENEAERLLVRIASAGLRCAVQPSDAQDESVYDLTVSDLRLTETTAARMRCWPLSLGSARAQPLQIGAGALFCAVPLALITPLFVFEVALSDGQLVVTKQSVIALALDGAPAQRAEAVLIDMLSSAGAFTRMLHLLMAGDDALRLSAVFGETSAALGGSQPRSTAQAEALLESLLHTYERAPDRLDEIARMIDDLRATGRGHEILPEGFAAIWEPIWQARQRDANKASVAAAGEEVVL